MRRPVSTTAPRAERRAAPEPARIPSGDRSDVLIGRGAHRARGFTLIEVLVALAVMAVMAAMAWKGIDGISHARTISEGRVTDMLRLNTVLAQWEQDLTSVEETDTVDEALSCDGQSLRLTRHSENGIQLVVWSLREGTLKRWVAPAATTTQALQDAWLRSQQLQGSEPSQLRALTHVSSWQVYFYQTNGWSNCQSTGNVVSVATPPAAAVSAVAGSVSGVPANTPAVTTLVQQRTQLPKGVRVVIAFDDGSPFAGTLTRDIRITP